MEYDDLVPLTGEDLPQEQEGRRGAAPIPGQEQEPIAGTSGTGGHHEVVPRTKKTAPELALSLNETFNQLQGEIAQLTTGYMTTTGKEALKIKQRELEALISVYKGEFQDLISLNLTPEKVLEWEKQRKIVSDWEAKIRKFFDDVKAMEQLGLDNDDIKEIVGASNPIAKSGDTELTHTYKFDAGSDGAVVVETLYKERDEHRKELEELRKQMAQIKTDNQKEMDQIRQSSENQLEQIKYRNQQQIEQLNSQLQRETWASERKIRSLREQMEERNPYELSVDEVDPDDPPGDGQIGESKEQGGMTLKLDSFQLTYFSGKLEEWETFRDMFEYLVNKSKKITNIMKFHQLRSHLKGAALDCIRGYQMTDQNYTAAWADLRRRFDRSSELTMEYIRKFLEVAAIPHNAKSEEIRRVIDATNQLLRALPGLQVPVTGWDPFLVFIVCTKLNEEIRAGWKQKQNRDAPFSITVLLEFLENTALEIQPSQDEKLSQMLSGDWKKRKPRKVFQISETKEMNFPTSTQAECGLCSKNHKVTECSQFKKASAKVKSNMIRKLKLCYKCLRNHQANECTKGNCGHCEKPHHPLLCFKKEAAQQGEARQVSLNSQDMPIREEWGKASSSKNAN